VRQAGEVSDEKPELSDFLTKGGGYDITAFRRAYDAWKDAYAEDNGSETDLENEMAEAFSNDDEARTVETRARSSVVDDTCEVFRQRVDGKQRQGRWCYFEP